MYPPVVNSPKTELTELITDKQTEITVANASVLLQGEGIAVLGNGDVAETITYTSVEENVLKGCVRGFEGVARAWPVGTRVARNFTASDFKVAQDNILEIDRKVTTLNTTVTEKTQDASLTQKGITQLSKAVDGTRDNVAAVESVVKVVYDLASSRETVSGAQAKANTAETNAKNYVDAKAWQKFKLTGDTGATIPKYLVSMNTLTDTGFYSGTGFTDSPDGTTGTFTVIVLRGGSDRDVVIQIAIKFDSTNGISTFMRTRRDATWYPWSRDLTDASVSILSGVGSPEGSITAPTGYLYRNLNGGANTTLYVKQTGTGNTGWRGI
ncbi:pyocin knob domain-containing protein [Paenibacillus sp. S02]|uniref:pyocin knob domain-containing protein n=1 Tax=Paenibacillus sp. S02 TaxID=2823904 RepID=UPI0021ABD2A7|nr:pyocin knob domain-containing protein [Paenibacillus sp. S02]